MLQSIPVGPWPDFETACAFGGNILRNAADAAGERVTEWAAVQRPDGFWKVEAYCYSPGQDFSDEGHYVEVGAD